MTKIYSFTNFALALPFSVFIFTKYVPEAKLVTSTAFTGSILGTASFATSALSSSFATTAITSSYPIRVTGDTLHSVAPLSNNSPGTVNNIFLGNHYA